MTLRQLVNDLTRLSAGLGVDLDAPVFIEGEQSEDEAGRVFFLPDSKRVYITRKRNA